MVEQSNAPEEPLEESGPIAEIGLTGFLSLSFTRALAAIDSTSRLYDWNYRYNHPLSILWIDLFESATSITLMTEAGVLNSARRELRFILESSIKIAFIHQENPDLSIDQKLESFRSFFDSGSISSKRRIDLRLLPADLQQSFYDELGRLHGETSRYVHLTTDQIRDRLEWLERRRFEGRDISPHVSILNKLIKRVLCASVVLLLHSAEFSVIREFLLEKLPDQAYWFLENNEYVRGVRKSVYEMDKLRRLSL